MTTWFLEVTDLKQYTCCPRIVYYRYCLPRIRPVTRLMAEGQTSHREEEAREERRSLKTYGVEQGERFFQLVLQSEALGITGCLDLAIATPGRESPQGEAIVVEYKHSEKKAGTHFKLQLAAYALLLEEAWGLPVRQSFLYSIPLREAERIPITPALRRKVFTTIAALRQMIEHERMPPAPGNATRCVQCEFRRFCNDVI